MGTFTNLYFAADAFRRAIAARIAITDVRVSAPSAAVGSSARVTVTLLMVNEEPTHKNDPPVRNADGSTTPAPTSLSATYLVTAESTSTQNDTAEALRYIGEIIRLFHDTPFLDLAALGLTSTQGVGRLHVALVPMTPDLMEKVFTPLQAAHRPFALFEVWPIQLKSTLPDGEPTAVVRPGGVNLGGPTPAARPEIQRVYPKRIAQGRFLRIDGAFAQPVSAVVIGSEVLDGAALGTVPGATLSEAVRVRVDAAVFKPGVHRVHVLTNGNLASEDEEILIEPAAVPSLDAPNTKAVSLAAQPLVLTGSGLGQATSVHVWPDAGVQHPSEVRAFAGVATANSVTLTLSNLPTGTYRAAVELTPPTGPSQFTPFVILEVVP